MSPNSILQPFSSDNDDQAEPVDWLEQVESDFDEPDFSPAKRRGRNAERCEAATKVGGEAGGKDTTLCQACGKGSRPSCLLLCDECDGPVHTTCLRPPLHVSVNSLSPHLLFRTKEFTGLAKGTCAPNNHEQAFVQSKKTELSKQMCWMSKED